MAADITRYQWFCGPVKITDAEAQRIADGRSPLVGSLCFMWYERVPTRLRPTWRANVIRGDELRAVLQ